MPRGPKGEKASADNAYYRLVHQIAPQRSDMSVFGANALRQTA